MAKVYSQDIGTTLVIDTGIDLTGYSALEIEMKDPAATETTLTATVATGYTVTDGKIEYERTTAWGQTGTWTFQAHITFDATHDYLGQTVTMSVYAAWA